jgi:acetyl-CoA carboxylase biotin carboxyl carrier protein
VAIEVKAEMVASVFKVLVLAGAPVAAGEAMVILESMKMEIPVLADAAGTVAEVCVAEGDVVHEGDVLVVLG